MRTAAEREVPTRPTMNVEAVGFVKVTFVAIRRGEHQQQCAARGHGFSVKVDIFRDPPGDVGSGRFEAQQFLDGGRDQRRIVNEIPALVRVFAEHLAHPPEQPTVISIYGGAWMAMLGLCGAMFQVGCSSLSMPEQAELPELIEDSAKNEISAT